MKTFIAHLPRRATRLVVLLFATATASAFAGTPLICHPYAIGDAPTLPGGAGPHGVATDYDRTHLVRDTLALLTPDRPVLVRMETLRRAAIYATAGMRGWDTGSYAAQDRELAAALLKRLRERLQKADERSRALAAFDAGFFAETLRQANLDPQLDGYALLVQAAALRPADPEIEFALALATLRPQRAEHARHLDRARAGARDNALLASNLASHFRRS